MNEDAHRHRTGRRPRRGTRGRQLAHATAFSPGPSRGSTPPPPRLEHRPPPPRPFHKTGRGRQGGFFFFFFPVSFSPFQLSPQTRIGSSCEHLGGPDGRRGESGRGGSPTLRESPSCQTRIHPLPRARGPPLPARNASGGPKPGIRGGDPPRAPRGSDGHCCPQGHHAPGRGLPVAGWAVAGARRL